MFRSWRIRRLWLRFGRRHVDPDQTRYADRHARPLKLRHLLLQSTVGHRHSRAQANVLRPRCDHIALDVATFLAQITVNAPTRRAIAPACWTYEPNRAQARVA